MRAPGVAVAALLAEEAAAGTDAEAFEAAARHLARQQLLEPALHAPPCLAAKLFHGGFEFDPRVARQRFAALVGQREATDLRASRAALAISPLRSSAITVCEMVPLVAPR